MWTQRSAKRSSLPLHSSVWGFVPLTPTLPGAALTPRSPHTQGTWLNSNPIPSPNSLLWKVLLANELGCVSGEPFPSVANWLYRNCPSRRQRLGRGRIFLQEVCPAHLHLEESQILRTNWVHGSQSRTTLKSPGKSAVRSMTGPVSPCCSWTSPASSPGRRSPTPSWRTTEPELEQTLWCQEGQSFPIPSALSLGSPGCFSDAKHREQGRAPGQHRERLLSGRSDAGRGWKL